MKAIIQFTFEKEIDDNLVDSKGNQGGSNVYMFKDSAAIIHAFESLKYEDIRACQINKVEDLEPISPKAK